MSVLETLQGVEVFEGLAPEQLGEIAEGCEERSYQAGDRLFAEGEEARHLWVLTRGRVDLRFDLPGRSSSPENTIDTVTEGEAMGWSSFVSPYEYKLSAYCAGGACSVICIEKTFLTGLFLRFPDMGYRVVSALTRVASRHFQHLQESAGAMPAAVTTVTVHMSTCGIAAGAKEVMEALVEEAGHADRQDVQVKRGRCIGRCRTEPNVTVEITGEDPVVYQKMNPEKMREVFGRHVVGGRVAEEYVLKE